MSRHIWTSKKIKKGYTELCNVRKDKDVENIHTTTYYQRINHGNRRTEVYSQSKKRSL